MTIITIYHQNKEIINYLIAGGLTMAVGLLSYYLCVLTFLDPQHPIQLQAANVISWIVAVTFAYFTNRRFVFESRNQKRKEAAAFFVARLITLGMDMACMFFMVTWIGINDKVAKLIVQVIIIVANYVLSKFIVFRKKEH